MSVIEKLATTLGRRDEVTNQELAQQIADDSDKKSVKELIELLGHKSKDLQHDSIKVLYEIAERKPALVGEYTQVFLDLLKHKNNRLQWGAMHAIDAITLEQPKLIYTALPEILAAADKGSVITRDHAVNILIKLGTLKAYAEDVFPLLIEQLMASPPNQVPMYAERAMPIIHEKNKAVFADTLRSRLDDMEKESKRKRVEKVIKRFS